MLACVHDDDDEQYGKSKKSMVKGKRESEQEIERQPNKYNEKWNKKIWNKIQSRKNMRKMREKNVVNLKTREKYKARNTCV